MEGLSNIKNGSATTDNNASLLRSAGALGMFQPRWRGALRKVGSYLWHLLQMVIAMEVGMFAYHLLASTVLARTDYAALTDAYPYVGYSAMVASMVVGMVAFMLWQRSTWRYCVEMSLVMVAPLVVLAALVVWALMPIRILYSLGDPLMIVAMAVYMLLRPHQHAHGRGHHVYSQGMLEMHSAHEHMPTADSASSQQPDRAMQDSADSCEA